jgi:hypothetical protein
MKSFNRFLIAIALLAAVSARLRAQSSGGWHDELVDRMAGKWTMTGPVMGGIAHHDVHAEWVLDHQFLRITEKTAASAAASERRYEAIWFLGYDLTSDRYVLHLVDVYGGRFSETLGYGVRDGNAIRFVFEYPDGPFHTAFQWSPESNSWQWLMTQKDKDGKWTTFADLELTRPAP